MGIQHNSFWYAYDNNYMRTYPVLRFHGRPISHVLLRGLTDTYLVPFHYFTYFVELAERYAAIKVLEPYQLDSSALCMN